MTFLVLHSSSWGREKAVGYFASFVFLVSCDCFCSVTLPHSAMCWSAVCDCGIS